MESAKSTEEFGIDFIGTAVASHEMDARHLGDALIGLSDLFTLAQKYYAPDSKVDLNMKAVRKGSFMAVLSTKLIPAAIALLTGQETTAVINAVALVTYVIDAITFLKNFARYGKPNNVKTIQDQNGHQKARVTFITKTHQTTAIEIEGDAINLAMKDGVLESVKATSAPLKSDGFDRINIVRKGKNAISINKTDAEELSNLTLDTSEPQSFDKQETIQLLDVSFRNQGKLNGELQTE